MGVSEQLPFTPSMNNVTNMSWFGLWRPSVTSGPNYTLCTTFALVLARAHGPDLTLGRSAL